MPGRRLRRVGRPAAGARVQWRRRGGRGLPGRRRHGLRRLRSGAAVAPQLLQVLPQPEHLRVVRAQQRLAVEEQREQPLPGAFGLPEPASSSPIRSRRSKQRDGSVSWPCSRRTVWSASSARYSANASGPRPSCSRQAAALRRWSSACGPAARPRPPHRPPAAGTRAARPGTGPPGAGCARRSCAGCGPAAHRRRARPGRAGAAVRRGRSPRRSGGRRAGRRPGRRRRRARSDR